VHVRRSRIFELSWDVFEALSLRVAAPEFIVTDCLVFGTNPMLFPENGQMLEI
jgi:hypothetical protein